MHKWKYTGISTVYSCENCQTVRIEITSIRNIGVREDFLRSKYRDEGYLYTSSFVYPIDKEIDNPSTIDGWSYRHESCYA